MTESLTSLRLCFYSLFVLVIILNLEFQILAKIVFTGIHPQAYLRAYETSLMIFFANCIQTWANWSQCFQKFSSNLLKTYYIWLSNCFLRTLCDDWRLNLIQRDTCFFCKAKKKSFLFSGNRPRENFLSPTRPHKSNVFENIYFLFQKTHTQTNKILLANSFVQIYVFFPFKQ